MTYYNDLNVLPTASMEEVDISYKKIISKEELSLDDEMKYNKAYSTLIDYNSRKKYDNLMEENTPKITAFNNNNYNGFFNIDCDNSDTDIININNKNDDKDSNIDINNDVLNKLEHLFAQLNVRLENIEKKIFNNNTNNNNFYKERKKINTHWKAGKKIVNITTDVNNNGDLSRKLKTIGYDSDGNQEITYKNINTNNLKDL
jgi:DnaJ-class molecular chaperone